VASRTYLEGLAKAGELHAFDYGGEMCITLEELDALVSKGGSHATGHWPRHRPKPGKPPTIRP
jgi:hypothetical protein